MRCLSTILFLLFASMPASAQYFTVPIKVTCYTDRPAFIEWMMGRYKEAPKHNGITSDEERLAEVWTTVDGSSWTLAIYDPKKGFSCVVAAGKDWRSLLWYIPQREVKDG